MKSQVNIRASALLQRQLDELTDKLGTSITETVSIAIDRMYQQEINMNNQLFVHLDAAKGPYPQIIEGQSVYGYEGKYWIGHISVSGYERRLKLTPVTDEQKAQLDKNYSFIIDGKL